MKITRIQVEYARKFPPEQFGNVSFAELVEAQMEETDDPTACRQELWQDVRASVQEQIREWSAEVKRRKQEVFDRLPDDAKGQIG